MRGFRWAGSIVLVLLASLAAASTALAQSADFEHAPTSPEKAGASPDSVAVGDFNHDSNPDLAVANTDSNDVTILLGDRTGNFTRAVTGPEKAGDYPADVAVGDFNGDSDPDLAVTDFDSGDVTILLGDGTGNFTAATTSPEKAGSFSDGVAVGDFNGDSRPDLAVANQGADSGDVTILLGDGTGNFDPAATGPEKAGDRATSVEVGDFNRDSHPDLAVADYTERSHVLILLGDGTGNFTPAPTSPEKAGDYPADVAVGDFNHDSHSDLAVANFNSGDVTILLGDGTGNFKAAPASPETADSFPDSVAVGDFNRDSHPDLAVGNSGRVTILLGDGTGNFTEPPTSPEHVGGSLTSVAVGDFNRDSRPDLAVANGTNVSILLNGLRGEEAPSCSRSGTAGNDVIRGTPGRDVICAAGGNDVVYGRGGNDVIRGGAGNDILRGGAGDDRLAGGPGRDTLYGNGGADSLSTQDARRGNDVARGGAGADSCATDPRDVRSSC